jgi:protein-disulfide isomerase
MRRMRGRSHGPALAALLVIPFMVVGASADTKPVPDCTPPEALPVAIVAGEEIASADLDKLVQRQLAELQQARLEAVEVLVARTLLQKEAAARGISERALDRTEVEDKVSVSEADAKAYYDDNKARFGSMAEADAIEQVRRGLARQRREERRAAFVRELRTRYGAKVLLEPYRVSVELEQAPIRGNPDAPVTVVEFSDFQCPFCVHARPAVERVRAAYGDKVRWVFRHFPLDFHPQALKAGEATACAGDQGKFWEMHDRLWQANGRLEVSALKKAAAEIGLDSARFDECLDSGRHTEAVRGDLGAGAGWGVNGTPAFFVNGRPLVGAQPFEAFQQVIDDELERIQSAGDVTR